MSLANIQPLQVFLLCLLPEDPLRISFESSIGGDRKNIIKSNKTQCKRPMLTKQLSIVLSNEVSQFKFVDSNFSI